MKNRRSNWQKTVSVILIFALWFGALPVFGQTSPGNGKSSCDPKKEKCNVEAEINPVIVPDSTNRKNSTNEKDELKIEILPPFKNTIGMQFVGIPAGEFMMGSSKGEKDEIPIRKVVISKPFYLGKFEVTQVEWYKIMGDNPSFFSDCGNDCPVEEVSWDNVQTFLKKLSAKENRYYRLPTEAEWEYAARAGSDKTYQFGDNITQKDANISDTVRGTRNNPDYKGQPTKVGFYQPNAWGLYDMHGNVWEWCWDNYGKYLENQTLNPVGADSGTRRVVRGGSWYHDGYYARSTNRAISSLTVRKGIIGFRVLLQPEEKNQ